MFRNVVSISRLSDVPVLLTGETGTRKKLLARAIHALDLKRRAGPFVAINCGAVSAGLAESELFANRRVGNGAVTCKDHNRPDQSSRVRMGSRARLRSIRGDSGYS